MDLAAECDHSTPWTFYLTFLSFLPRGLGDLNIVLRPNKKIGLFTVTSQMSDKNGLVGRDCFFFLCKPKQLKCTYWLSLCFTSINFVFIKEKWKAKITDYL